VNRYQSMNRKYIISVQLYDVTGLFYGRSHKKQFKIRFARDNMVAIIFCT